MPGFRYTAVGQDGSLQNGVMDAGSESDVVRALQRQGAVPLRAEPIDKARWWQPAVAWPLTAAPGLTRQQTADVIRELATMLGAGQDLDRALRYMQETAGNARLRRVVSGLRDAVRDGKPLSEAMGREARSFSRLHIGMVRAGEAAGNLGPTLARLADLLDRQRGLSAAVTSALIYPSLLLIAAAGSVTLLLTSVLPQFVPMFEQSGAKLPPSTQFLLDAGDAIATAAPFIPPVVLGLVVLIRMAVRHPPVRLGVDRFVLRLPIVGSVWREILAARFTRVLGTLLTNGVALIPALGVVRDTLGNAAAVAAVDDATAAARSGDGLSTALDKAGVFPPRTIHLVRLGEENAQLGQMASRAADIHEERTRLAVQRMVALLVPGITIAMGALVAGIVASLMTAMLSLNDLAGG